MIYLSISTHIDICNYFQPCSYTITNTITIRVDLGGSGWTWLDLGGSCWIWVDLGGSGWIWMDLGGSGWIWVDLGGSEWIWMDLGGSGWIWVDLGRYEAMLEAKVDTRLS